MSDPDYRELKLKQTELFVAQQISDVLSLSDKQDLYIEPLPLNDIVTGKLTSRDYTYQQMGLRRLVEEDLIQILNSSAVLSPGIHVHIVDIPAFRAFLTDLSELIPSTGHGARIVYSPKTGAGKVNGKPFKLNSGSRNRKVFGYMAKNPNKYLTKQKLWVIAGEKGKFTEDSDKVNEFNTIITTLRGALKNISPQHLRLNKTVILDAEVTLTE